jgi:hypothetical protein
MFVDMTVSSLRRYLHAIIKRSKSHQAVME